MSSDDQEELLCRGRKCNTLPWLTHQMFHQLGAPFLSRSATGDDRVPLAGEVGLFQESVVGFVAELDELAGNSVLAAVEVEQFDEVGPGVGDVFPVGPLFGEPSQNSMHLLTD